MKRILSIIGLTLLYSSTGYGYVQTRHPETGASLRWPGLDVQPVFFANEKNNDSLSHGDIFTALTHSFQRWKHSNVASVGFDYWQGSNSGTPNYLSYDGKNAIFFTSNSPDSLGGGTIGSTMVVFAGNTILETDIILNDTYFDFTTNPADTTVIAPTSRVFLENVTTHEIGHAYGLNHSASLQSTMMFLEHRGAAKPSCDDLQGMASQYPNDAFKAGRGSISVKIVSGETDVFGAHVVAISKTRGTVVSAALSEKDGLASLPNLEPGDYFLFVEPFQGATPLSSLCGGSAANCYYGTVNSSTVCSGNPFKRSFIESASGTPLFVTVSGGQTTAVGAIEASCTEYTGGTPSASVASAPTLLSNNENSEVSAARTMVFGSEASHYYKLNQVSGNIKVTVLSYGLFAPFDPEVSLLSSDGSTPVVGSVATDNIFSNASGYTNYDTQVELASAPKSDYVIKVTNKADLSGVASNYPGGSVPNQIDSLKYYLVMVTINDATTTLPVGDAPSMVENARCERDDDFAAFPDHGEPPGQSGSAAPQFPSAPNESSGSGGCIGGILADQARSATDEWRGPGPGALFSIWGLAMIMLLGRLTMNLARKIHTR